MFWGGSKTKSRRSRPVDDALLDRFDEGWFAGPTTSSTTNNIASTSRPSQIPALRPPLSINTAAYTAQQQQQQDDGGSNNFDSTAARGVQRPAAVNLALNRPDSSISVYQDVSTMDTPRSSFSTHSISSTALSLLPQTTAELEGLSQEDVRLLAFEAEQLHQRAATALALTQQHLLHQQQQQPPIVTTTTLQNTTNSSNSDIQQRLRNGEWSIATFVSLILDMWVLLCIVGDVILTGLSASFNHAAAVFPPLGTVVEVLIECIRVGRLLLQLFVGFINTARVVFGLLPANGGDGGGGLGRLSVLSTSEQRQRQR